MPKFMMYVFMSRLLGCKKAVLVEDDVVCELYFIRQSMIFLFETLC